MAQEHVDLDSVHIPKRHTGNARRSPLLAHCLTTDLRLEVHPARLAMPRMPGSGPNPPKGSLAADDQGLGRASGWLPADGLRHGLLRLGCGDVMDVMRCLVASSVCVGGFGTAEGIRRLDGVYSVLRPPGISHRTNCSDTLMIVLPLIAKARTARSSFRHEPMGGRMRSFPDLNVAEQPPRSWALARQFVWGSMCDYLAMTMASNTPGY